MAGGATNLPLELTSFVGRRRELAEVKRLLGTTRLLTLTGSGGSGKTRLALRAAAEMARAFPDGAWLVPLAPIEDPLLVTHAILNALGVQDRSAGWSLSALTDHLAGKRLLLVLDNCEHLLDSCAVMAGTLLKSCPELRLLATSRQALGAAGEVRMRVPSLSMPKDGGEISVDRLLNFDAVALLVERATTVAPAFKVDEASAAGVLRLCRRLDGIPLALELAAGRLDALSIEQLNEGLSSELSVLGRGNRAAESRQQTLEATIGWSYQLLDEQERRLWARLSVFAGGFEQEAAVQVCAGLELPGDQVVQLLASLVEKSVLQLDSAAHPPRYLLLETIRQYGRERLRDLGEEGAFQTRHRDWILALAIGAGASDHRQAEMINRVHSELDNVWSALEFCQRRPGEADVGVDICRHLLVYWHCRGQIGDTRRMVASILERTAEDSFARAQGLWLGAGLALSQGDFPEAQRMAEQSLRIGRLLGNAEVVCQGLIYKGTVAWAQGLAEAAAAIESALTLAATMENELLMLFAGVVLCAVRLANGDLEGTVAVGDQTLALSVRRGELYVRGGVLGFLSEARWRLGEPERAEALAKDGAVCKHELGDQSGLPLIVETLAWMAMQRGAAKRASTLIGAATRMRESYMAPLFEPQRPQHEQSELAARDQLGETAFAAAFQRGVTMTDDEAFAFVIERQEPAKPAPATTAEPVGPLTRRELEIARLIAEGVTTRQIAAKLFISERTVETHVTNMLNKLGLNSRIQLASWVSSKVEPPHS